MTKRDMPFGGASRLAGVCAAFGATFPATYLVLCILPGWDFVPRELATTALLGGLSACMTFGAMALRGENAGDA